MLIICAQAVNNIFISPESWQLYIKQKTEKELEHMVFLLAKVPLQVERFLHEDDKEEERVLLLYNNYVTQG